MVRQESSAVTVAPCLQYVCQAPRPVPNHALLKLGPQGYLWEVVEPVCRGSNLRGTHAANWC